MSDLDKVKVGDFIKQGYTVRGVVHIGANDGYEVQWYQKLGIEHILCFEPGFNAYTRFMRDYPTVPIRREALGNIEATADLHITRDGDGGSTLFREPTSDRSEKVAIRRWAGLDVDRSRYNMCVIDVQGMELDVLRGMDEYITDFDFFIIECSAAPIYKGGAYGDEVVAYMNRMGFDQTSPMMIHNDIYFVKHGLAKNIIKTAIEIPKGNKLNIGSGQRRFDIREGWVNIDCVSRAGQVPDLICNVGHDILPYADESIDIVVLNHVYEHFGCGEGHGIIQESHRVLRAGGSLILTMPDWRALAQRWLTGQIDDWIYFINLYGAYQGEEGDRHKWGYTLDGVKKELEHKTQWTTIKRFDWRNLPGAAVPADWWIAGYEAVK